MVKLCDRLNNTIEDKLFCLAINKGYNYDTVLNQYEVRKKNIALAFGEKYKGRESHILVKAYQGTIEHFKDYNGFKRY